MSARRGGESVLARAVRILEAFTPDAPALTVSEVARRSGLHVATASRLVAELAAHGLLVRDEQRLVRVGVRLWELASRASPALTLRERAMPFLEGVHDVVGHHVQLAVRDGTQVLFVERLSTPGSVVNYTRIAGRLPLHASSSGLVLLAYAPAEVREHVLEGGRLHACTSATPATPPRLRAQLAAVRRDGYAYCPGFVHEDALGIAAPVRDATSEVVAAVGVVVPNSTDARAHIPVVRTAARGISRALGAAVGERARAGPERERPHRATFPLIQ